MRLITKEINNPIGHISSIREYGSHYRFKFNWDKLDVISQEVVKEIYGADLTRLCITLLVPIKDNYLDLSDCRLHISEFDVVPSLSLISAIDDYIIEHNKLPDFCGIRVSLNAEEKVNLLALL